MPEEGAPELVANTVAERVQQLRKERKWTQQDLAAAMTAKGWPTDRSTVVRLEKRQRGISVDDLVALAAALNVSPGWLVVPAETGETEVPLLGNVKVPAWAAWQWVEGLAPLPTRAEQDSDDYGYDGWNTSADVEDFQMGRPAEMRRRDQHPATRAARDLGFRLQRVLIHETKAKQATDKADLGIATALRATRSALARVVAELDELEAQFPADDRRR